MKNEYKDLYNGITPSKELENKVISGVENKRRIAFSPKKCIAVAAVFVAAIAGTFGAFEISSNRFADTGKHSDEQAASDFSIVAYAKDSESDIKTISDYAIDLMNLKITLYESNQENYVEVYSSDNGLAVRSDDEIESVTFESQNGSFSYLDTPLINYMISQKIYYAAIIPLTQAQYEEFNNLIENAIGEEADELKEQFVSELMNSMDCSQYIYDDDFDVSKIATHEYLVHSSDMADAVVNYYDYCLVIDKIKSGIVYANENCLVAKTYQSGDIIEYVYYNPDEAVEYLLNYPDADFSELPSDTIKITVKFKNGQSATKEVVTSFDSDGTLKMKLK